MAAKFASLRPGRLARRLRYRVAMSGHRCLRRTLDDADCAATAPAHGPCEGHPPTALERLRQPVHAASSATVRRPRIGPGDLLLTKDGGPPMAPRGSRACHSGTPGDRASPKASHDGLHSEVGETPRAMVLLAVRRRH